MDSSTVSSVLGPPAKDMEASGPESSSVRPRTPMLAWSNKRQSSSNTTPTESRNHRESPVHGTSSNHSKENTPANKGNSTKSITRVHIRRKDQPSKSAGAVLLKNKDSADEEAFIRPSKRNSRVHVITDKERASNIEADKLSADICLPRAWQASWSLQKAQRQNRTHQKQLSVRLECIDKGLLVKFNKITNSERRLLNEFLSKYPEMYHHVMGGLRDKATVRRLGIFPAPRTHNGAVPVLPPGHPQDAEAAVIRAHLKAPGGREFPPLHKRKVQIVPPSSPSRRTLSRAGQPRSPQVNIQLKGVRFEKEPDSDSKEKYAAGAGLPGQATGKTSGFITTPGVVVPTGKHQQPVNVSYFVDTDFGFQPDRQRQAITGMSLQKDIQDRTQLEKDIEKVAKKHINAMTTGGLNHRASRKMEGVETLRSTIYGTRGDSNRGTPISRDGMTSPTKMVSSPRGRRKLRSGGPLPPLEKDVTKVLVVGKADGPLVADANKAIAANASDNMSFCDW